MLRKLDPKSIHAAHLNDAQLVAYLDGEVSLAELPEFKAHLESCWGCRGRLIKVEKNIAEFVANRESALPEATSFDGLRVEQFRHRLQRHAQAQAEVEPEIASIPERFAALRHALRAAMQFMGQHQKAALAATMAILLVVFLFTDALNTRVSADTVLRHAEVFETTHAPATGQVDRESIHSQRIDRSQHATRDLGNLTVIRDARHLLLARLELAGQAGAATTVDAAASGKLLQELFADEPQKNSVLQYLGAQGWVPEISAESFRQLIAGRDDSQTSVRRDAGEVELHYAFASGHLSGITEALLTVRDSDYAPVSVSLVMGGEREYRFTRSQEVTEQRSQEPLLLAYANPSHTTGNPALSPLEPPMRRPVPMNYQNSQASGQEVAAAEALHKLDACLGEEVYLFPMSDGSLLVQGLVDSPARREAIRQALRGVPGKLQVQVYLPRELKSGSELYNPPDQFEDRPTAAVTSGSATLADLSSARMPLYDKIFKHFATPGIDPDATDKQVAMFSNEVVTMAQQTFLHAWALKRLDREFSPARTAGLPAAALNVVEQLRQDHRRWISTYARRQSEMLSAVADPALSANASGLVEARQNDTDLLRIAQEQNDLVRALFTTSQSTAEPETVLSRLMTLLRRMGS